jgi:hypothetical protein
MHVDLFVVKIDDTFFVSVGSGFPVSFWKEAGGW